MITNEYDKQGSKFKNLNFLCILLNIYDDFGDFGAISFSHNLIKVTRVRTINSPKNTHNFSPSLKFELNL